MGLYFTNVINSANSVQSLAEFPEIVNISCCCSEALEDRSLVFFLLAFAAAVSQAAFAFALLTVIKRMTLIIAEVPPTDNKTGPAMSVRRLYISAFRYTKL